jgi:hypothetical protein
VLEGRTWGKWFELVRVSTTPVVVYLLVRG